jgi:hypothetical protein
MAAINPFYLTINPLHRSNPLNKSNNTEIDIKNQNYKETLYNNLKNGLFKDTQIELQFVINNPLARKAINKEYNAIKTNVVKKHDSAKKHDLDEKQPAPINADKYRDLYNRDLNRATPNPLNNLVDTQSVKHNHNNSFNSEDLFDNVNHNKKITHDSQPSQSENEDLYFFQENNENTPQFPTDDIKQPESYKNASAQNSHLKSPSVSDSDSDELYWDYGNNGNTPQNDLPNAPDVIEFDMNNPFDMDELRNFSKNENPYDEGIQETGPTIGATHGGPVDDDNEQGNV